MFPDYSKIKLQPLEISWLSATKVEAAMLRLDLLHPEISGNKWFKLKYNIQEALSIGKDTLLTFGGVRSNHIAAVAAAAPLFGLQSIGVIRGEASAIENPTLSRARQQGMELVFLSRSEYKKKLEAPFLTALKAKFPHAYVVPEGGNNDLGFKGAKDILAQCPAEEFTHICCAVGTGSTLAGIVATASENQKVIGYCALKKAQQQRAVVESYLKDKSKNSQWRILEEDYFGGFAQRNTILDQFISSFMEETQIPLDFVYNGKMLFQIKKGIEEETIPPGSKVLIIHTGGLQGNLK